MKIAASFVFLLLVPMAFGQNAVAPPPAPAKMQEQATKLAPKVDPEKEAAIRKLFEVAGTKANVEKVIAGMTENMKPMFSKLLPPGDYQEKLIPLFFERFQSKVKTEELLNVTVSIYDKYFSKEEIEGLTQFYQTPLGKKVLSVLPQVLIESQTAGMKMGQEAGRQAMMEVLAEHPDLQKALEEAGARKN